MKLLRYNGKKIGYIEGRKLIKSGRQVVLFRMMDGFGMPKDLVDDVSSSILASRVNATVAQAPGTNRNAGTERDEVLHEKQGVNVPASFNLVEIHYHNKIYQASVLKFMEKGTIYHKPPFEAQYILPRKEFLVVDINQLGLL